MDFPKELKYTKTHEWVKKDGDVYIAGVSEYAQKEISDVVYVELPDVGREATAAKGICVVESVKAAFDIYSPISGKVVKVNDALEGDPALVNSDPYGEGWIVKLEGTDESEMNGLMDSAAYAEYVAGE